MSDIKTDSLKVRGDIKLSTGGGGIVNARWGEILGQLENQLDLIAALAKKADDSTVSALSVYAHAIADELDTVEAALPTKADKSIVDELITQISGILTALNGKADKTTVEGLADDLDTLSDVVTDKIDKPSSATDGDFLRYRNGTWTAETVATWEGGSF